MRVLILVLSLLATGCTATAPPAKVVALLDEATATASRQIADHNPAAAVQFVGAVLRIDPDHAGALEVRESLASEEFDYVFESGVLGSNRAPRVRVDRSVVAQILLYLPDRILDLFDIFSFDAHIGLGAFLNVHLTRAVQVGAGGRATSGIGWHDHRSLGVLAQTGSEFVLPGVGAQAFAGAMAGTSGVMVIGDGLAGVHTPLAELYQQYRDYCAIGFQATAGVAGLDFDFHPLELADFLAGWLTVDFLRDDFAGTRGLSLSSAERRLLWQLAEIERSRPALLAYRESLEQPEEPAPDQPEAVEHVPD